MIDNPELQKLITRLGEEDVIAECIKFVITEEYNKANDCLDAILAENENEVMALFAKAVTLNATNEWGKAVQSVTNGLKLDPDNALGHMIKGEIFYDANSSKNSKKLYWWTMD